MSALADRFVAFDQTAGSLKKWLTRFGVEEQARNLVHVLNGEGSKEEVCAAIRDSIAAVLESKARARTSVRDKFAAKIEARNAEEANRIAAAELKAAQAATPSQEPGSQPSIEEGATAAKEGGKQMSRNASKAKIAASKDEKGSLGTLHTDGKTSLTPAPVVFERDNIDGDFRPVLIQMWQQLSATFKAQMKSIFQGVRTHRERAFHRDAEIQRCFLGYLERLDHKQEILDAFVAQFNAFSDEYPDLREDEQTKEELHQRTDVLSDELWEIVEERREQNIEERRKVMEAGQVEFGLEFLTLSAQQLMQAELDRFKVSIQIIHDYYHAVEEKNTPELTAPACVELHFEGDEMPPVEAVPEGADRSAPDSYTYPRLEKLLAMALRMQAVPDVTQQVAAAAADKKGKPAKGKAAAAVEEEKSVEESAFAREMKEAVKVEKSILRFRLVQIRNWSLQRLQETRRQALRLYKKLEDWVQVAQRAEMDAIEEMSAVIKTAIEDETKIQSELRIRFMDFTVDRATLNFITPQPPKLEALEEFREDRFTIPQLQALLAEMSLVGAAAGSPMLSLGELSSLLFCKIKMSNQFGGIDSSLPARWNALKLHDITRILRNLDPLATGRVDWRVLFTYMALERSPVPAAADVPTQGVPSENGFAEKEAFVAHKWWFAASESSKDRDYSHTFERVRMLSEMLFEANKTTVEGGREVINVAEFARKVALPAGASQKGGPSVFHDLLFGSLKH